MSKSKAPTWGDVMSDKAGRPIKDAQVEGTCDKCGTKQTLAEARITRSPKRTEYRCKNGCAILTCVVVRGPGMLALENRVEIGVQMLPKNADPNLS
jgi:hypothetical protein